MRQEEVKNEKINKYLSEHQGVLEAPWELREKAFKAGWNECMQYLQKIPWDEAMEEIGKFNINEEEDGK